MNEFKVKVIKEIDEALTCKGRLDPCHCQVVNGSHYECDGCRIKRVLFLSRACIIQGAEELALLKVRFIGVQDAIIAKLKSMVKPEELEIIPAGFEEGDD